MCQVVFGVSLGKEIDMWSLGCVLAELYLGERLFLGDTIEEILTKVISITHSDLSRVSQIQ